MELKQREKQLLTLTWSYFFLSAAQCAHQPKKEGSISSFNYQVAMDQSVTMRRHSNVQNREFKSHTVFKFLEIFPITNVH